MAPACQGDESLAGFVEALVQSRADVQDQEAPAMLPQTDDKTSKKQKRSQPEMQAQIAVDSVVEHGIQIAAMLPGGLSVLGVYLYAPDAAFTSSTHQLCQVLDGVLAGAAASTADKLLFISSQSRKFLCKQRTAGTASSAALPVCDFKLAPLLSGFSIATCRYQAQLALPLTDNTKQLSAHVDAAISAESQCIQQSMGCIQGHLASSSTTVADLQQPLELELLSPPACCCASQGQDATEASVRGRVLLRGALQGRAMVHKKDTLAAAVDFLKADLVGSLQARMDILMAEAEDLAGTAGAGSSSRPALLSQPHTDLTLPLPARVFFPVKQILSFSDYLASGETRAEMTYRLQPLLGSSADLTQAEIPEGTEATQQSVSCTRHWDPRPECGSVKRGLNACSSSTFGMSLAVAFVAGATALYAAH